MTLATIQSDSIASTPGGGQRAIIVGATVTDWDLLAAWRRTLKARNYSKATIDGYRRTIAVFLIWCADQKLTLAGVDHTQIGLWLDSLAIGPRTRYAYTSTLASFYDWALREEHVPKDPTLRVERPRLGRYLPRPAPTSAVMDALSSASPRVVAMICCGALAGMRRSEIAHLRAEDLLTDRDEPLILIHGKGDKERLVPLHPALLTALRAYGIPRSGWLFPNREGKPLTPGYVGRLIVQAFDGLFTPHQLRHLFATLCYADSGGDLRMTQELLGHASVTSTSIYTAWSRPQAARVVSQLMNAGGDAA